jgi:hypothetical protein
MSARVREPDQRLLDAAQDYIALHEQKANANERRARLATILLTATTASIPVLIVASTTTHEFLLGKLLPSVMAGVAAMIAALTQVERPHDRWALYRRTQRVWEAERFCYLHAEGAYSGPDADARFVRWMADARVATHDEWAGLLPRASDVAKLSSRDAAG